MKCHSATYIAKNRVRSGTSGVKFQSPYYCYKSVLHTRNCTLDLCINKPVPPWHSFSAALVGETGAWVACMQAVTPGRMFR